MTFNRYAGLVVSLGLAGSVLLAACDEVPTAQDSDLSGDDIASSHRPIDGSTATHVSGGGHIVEGDWNIGFAGQSKTTRAGIRGRWVIQFHNVSVAAVDGGRFKATKITEMDFFDGDDPSCEAQVNVFMTGRFSGEPGWSGILRVGDAGHTRSDDDERGKRKSGDTGRVQLLNPAGDEVYDSHDVDFTDESNCHGTFRTGLDQGNLRIR